MAAKHSITAKPVNSDAIFIDLENQWVSYDRGNNSLDRMIRDCDDVSKAEDDNSTARFAIEDQIFNTPAASLIGIRTKLRLMHHYFECMQTQEQKVVRQTLVFVENLLGNEPDPFGKPC